MNATVQRPSKWVEFEETNIAGIRVVTASRADLVEAMVNDCWAARLDDNLPARLIFDLNGHGISMTRTDPAFGKALADADVVHCDGGIWVKMSKMTRATIKERSSTTDMMVDFAERCEREGLSFYILGGTPEVNAKFQDYLHTTYPKLKIAGRRDGYFKPEEIDAVLADINAAQPDVLWVGTGKPREQVWSLQYRDRIKAGWIVTCGGCYNYFVGEYKRAPQWMQNSGIEWLHRMATEPSKFAWRYITTNPHSLALASLDLLKRQSRK